MKTEKDIMDFQLKVGENIEHFRNLRKLNTKQIAAALNIGEVSYRNIERGISELTLSKMLKIANILKVNYAQILEFDSSMVFNNNGTANVFAHTNNQMEDGYKLCIQQYKEENTFLKNQLKKNIK